MPAPTLERRIEFQKTGQEQIGRRGTELARIEGAVLGMFRHNWAHTAARQWLKAFVFWGKTGAGDGIRTHDFNLGKVDAAGFPVFSRDYPFLISLANKQVIVLTFGLRSLIGIP